MNILLISQCDKRALTETRRILDQFAERRGARTWQTPITRDGLETLRRLLRKSARKNTAVACHWIRGLDHSELLWIVGDRRRFNPLGAVPTNTTQRSVLRRDDENDWHTGELIRQLADLAGLLHDLGKAIHAFQARLRDQLQGRNLIRHEWVSVRLLEAFVGADDDAAWLARLAAPSAADDARWLGALRRDGLDGSLDSPFVALANAPLAQALAWLILTHHRLPELPPNEHFQASALRGLLTRIEPAWNETAFLNAECKALEAYWRFPEGLPITTPAWRQRASRLARRLGPLVVATGSLPTTGTVLDEPFVMHLARLCLMLADHHYSSLEGDHPERIRIQSDSPLLANTRRASSEPNQRLDEHLIGVARQASEIAHFLPRFERHLPRLGQRRALKRRAKEARFRWQDKAADAAAGMRERTQQQGAFIVNMASTGCGKTLGNARIMNALADPVLGMRCAFALGLRTLTLQTGRAFRELLGVDEEALAVRVGGAASRTLFERQEAEAEVSGSASRQSLLDEEAHVVYEGQLDAHPLLRRALVDANVNKLLVAPLLVCTIDHLMPATDSPRGGHQIAPMLRLMSGDLVLDEPDDFDLDDLPALTRLVHWAGMLGARVLLSSATLPPALVQGLFEAYRNGRHHFQRNRGAEPGRFESPPAVCCAWFDEFEQQVEDCADVNRFVEAHALFAQRRAGQLAACAAHARQRATIRPLLEMPNARHWEPLAKAFAPQVLDAAARLHAVHHSVDPSSGKRVSFGLVRMANIEPLIEVALALFQLGPPPGMRVHLCVYHARHPLLIRSAIETQLDRTLRRHQPEAVFVLPEMRQRLHATAESDQLFIVLGSPVTEVGRDHDFDWALVEPSSMRSLIQLAGRVRRHRTTPVTDPNILVFSHNLRHYRDAGKAAFCQPGFELDSGEFRLVTHDLRELLTAEEIAVVDARARIVVPDVSALRPAERLIDLEQARLYHRMLPRLQSANAGESSGRRQRASAAAPVPALNASAWWQLPPRDALLSALLPRQQPFRKASVPPNVTLVLLPDEDGEEAYLYQVMEHAHRGDPPYALLDRSMCVHVPDACVRGERIEPWGVTDYVEALSALASALDLPLEHCARHFGTCAVRPSESGWRYHPALGFAVNRSGAG
ncbi:type I-F CRISPR-associated helicase Cas3f [Thioalkalicoccus limnaeus]|uniref:Type I-F CRISPR-associated helicase Cas3f n=1 Tax=Thioalkalicoccus limnaeus TaxID=120681 RepID=A0ABV4BF99_9GAMM